MWEQECHRAHPYVLKVFLRGLTAVLERPRSRAEGGVVASIGKEVVSQRLQMEEIR